ncbi:hypothetical protein P5V15_009122 [Pogonomyrmex californicus]
MLITIAYCFFPVTNLYLVLQVTPPLDVETMSQTLKEKNILPSNLKFGFLGLGIMGSGIVKNLINSGHTVIVWNRTQEKVCTDIFFSFFFSIKSKNIRGKFIDVLNAVYQLN